MTIMRRIIGQEAATPKGNRKEAFPGYDPSSMTQDQFPRKKKRLLIEFVDSEGTKRTAFTRDLSMTGFFVVSELAPAVGSEQEIRLHLPKGIVGVPARIVRVGRGSAKVEGAAPNGFAITLSSLCEPYVKLVESLL
jgi:hypothetical protein